MATITARLRSVAYLYWIAVPDLKGAFSRLTTAFYSIDFWSLDIRKGIVNGTVFCTMSTHELCRHGSSFNENFSLDRFFRLTGGSNKVDHADGPVQEPFSAGRKRTKIYQDHSGQDRDSRSLLVQVRESPLWRQMTDRGLKKLIRMFSLLANIAQSGIVIKELSMCFNVHGHSHTFRW